MKVDAENRLLWRKLPARLEAEAVRDAMLAAAGRLDRTLGGPSYLDFRTYFFKGTQFYDPVEQVGPAFDRRSLYRMGARGGRNPFLATFDCPDPSTTTPRRAVTTTPLQALSLLNNAMVLHLSEQLAGRLRHEAGEDISACVRRAFELAYARPADERELALVVPFVRRHGLEAFCRVVFNSNEFVQVD